MTLYAYPDGHLSLHINATHETQALYHQGKRTLIHLPVGWSALREPKIYGEHAFEPRALQAGDKIGLTASPVRIAITEILEVRKIYLHDLLPSDLVALGRRPDGLAAYRESWDSVWGDGDGWPWDSNPEVYAIYWKPLRIPAAAPDLNPCPPLGAKKEKGIEA